jgi:hypothetical protein
MYTVGSAPADGARRGEPPAKNHDRLYRVIAKPGYAVGAMTVRTGVDVVGLSLTFMKVKGNRLDPKDAYESEWIGSPSLLPKVTVGGDGAPAVGICGRTRTNEPLRALGLLVDPTGKAP